tara:strand:- start:1172 stop:1513 length:342 start_codon:yes stop_codon:yes gene_type:complete
MVERLELEEVSFVRMEGSWGATEPVKRTMKITAWICEDRMRGGFEIYDIETGGEEFYGEGGIWLSDDEGFIEDYDGVGMIDLRILAWLDDLGHVDKTGFFRTELDKYNTHWEA